MVVGSTLEVMLTAWRCAPLPTSPEQEQAGLAPSFRSLRPTAAVSAEGTRTDISPVEDEFLAVPAVGDTVSQGPGKTPRASTSSRLEPLCLEFDKPALNDPSNGKSLSASVTTSPRYGRLHGAELRIALPTPCADKLWHGTSLVTIAKDVVMSRRPKMLPMPHPDQQMHVSFLLDQSSFQTHEPSNVKLSELPMWPGILQGLVHSVRRAARPGKRNTATKHQNQSRNDLGSALEWSSFGNSWWSWALLSTSHPEACLTSARNACHSKSCCGFDRTKSDGFISHHLKLAETLTSPRTCSDHVHSLTMCTH